MPHPPRPSLPYPLVIPLLLGGILLSPTLQAKQPQPTRPVIQKNGTLYLTDPALLRERPPKVPAPPPSTPNNHQTSSTNPPTLNTTPTPSSRASTLHQTPAVKGPSPDSASAPKKNQNPPNPPRQTQAALPLRQTSSRAPARPSGYRELQPYPQTILRVGTDIPVPTDYAPPQIAVTGQSVAVAPATPIRFAVAETGVRFDGTRFSSSELAGFINYGSPIFIIAPERAPDGSTLQPRAITVPNPILQPVFRRIELNTH